MYCASQRMYGCYCGTTVTHEIFYMIITVSHTQTHRFMWRAKIILTGVILFQYKGLHIHSRQYTATLRSLLMMLFLCIAMYCYVLYKCTVCFIMIPIRCFVLCRSTSICIEWHKKYWSPICSEYHLSRCHGDISSSNFTISQTWDIACRNTCSHVHLDQVRSLIICQSMYV